MPFLLGQPQLLFLVELHPVTNKDIANKNINKMLFTFFIKSDTKLNYFHNHLLRKFDKRHKN